jgi:hypothetical protein
LLTNPAALNAANSSTVVSPPPARYIERPCQHRAHIITIASARTASGAALAAPLKLRFDSCLIDDGPYRSDFPVIELVKHILRKWYLAPINLKAEKTSLGRAVKSQAARDKRRLAGEEVNIEMEVWDFTKIPLKHFTITVQPDLFAVVIHFVMNEML